MLSLCYCGIIITDMKHKVLDLFSGIGGFSLGLQNTGGFETVAFCEIEPFCHKVLKKHWQDVPIYNDIKELNYDTLQADGIKPDVITGGFPCQDISVAGPGKGIIGERSSLWSEYARLIKDVRPTWAIIENVSALRSKGLTLVLQNLSEIGYNAEWHCIPCTAVGGLHRRDRLWIIAYPMANSNSRHGYNEEEEVRTGREAIDSSSYGERGGEETMGDSNNSRDRTPQRRAHRVRKEEGGRWEGQSQSRSSRSSQVVANSPSIRQPRQRACGNAINTTQIVKRKAIKSFNGRVKNKWTTEPNVGRVAYGIPKRVDRLKGLGNAVVPQIPQFLGESILNFEKENI